MERWVVCKLCKSLSVLDEFVFRRTITVTSTHLAWFYSHFIQHDNQLSWVHISLSYFYASGLKYFLDESVGFVSWFDKFETMGRMSSLGIRFDLSTQGLFRLGYLDPIKWGVVITNAGLRRHNLQVRFTFCVNEVFHHFPRFLVRVLQKHEFLNIFILNWPRTFQRICIPLKTGSYLGANYWESVRRFAPSTLGREWIMQHTMKRNIS